MFNERSDIVFPQDMFTVITARHYCRYQGTVITYTLKCKQKQRQLHKLNNKHGTTTSLVRDTQREWGFVLSCWVRCWKWAHMELNSSTWLSLLPLQSHICTVAPFASVATFILIPSTICPCFQGRERSSSLISAWAEALKMLRYCSILSWLFFSFWMQIRSSCFSLHGHKTTTGKL